MGERDRPLFETSGTGPESWIARASVQQIGADATPLKPDSARFLAAPMLHLARNTRPERHNKPPDKCLRLLCFHIIVRIERAVDKPLFESGASTSFTTPARPAAPGRKARRT